MVTCPKCICALKLLRGWLTIGFGLHLLITDSFLGPRTQINNLRELAVVIDLDAFQSLIVELKPLEIEHNRRWQMLDIGPSLDIDQPVVILVALVLIIALEDVGLHIKV